MAKVTSKLQVTIPKDVADQYGLRPGSRIEFIPAGDAIRVVPEGRALAPDDSATRLRLFDDATRRQAARNAKRPAGRSPKTRGWRREDLYGRGLAG